MRQRTTAGEKPREQAIIPLRVTRRSFLKSSGAAAAIAGASVAAACSTSYHEPPISPGVAPVPEDQQYPEVPPNPSGLAEQGNILKFFSPEEGKTVDALASRIIPGDAGDPGAHEAGVLYFIDYALASAPSGDGWNEPHYRSGPFAKPYDGPTPPGPDTSDTIYVSKSELPRYGYQSKLNPQQVFRQGLQSLDTYAMSTFGSAFAGLSPGQQDSVVGDLAGGTITGFDEPTADDFWSMVRDHTIQGMFSDPSYGGNRGMVGWKLTGYPGAQRAYTPHDIKTPGTPLQPQSLAQLPHFHSGLAGERSEIQPVSGSYQPAAQGR